MRRVFVPLAIATAFLAAPPSAPAALRAQFDAVRYEVSYYEQINVDLHLTSGFAIVNCARRTSQTFRCDVREKDYAIYSDTGFRYRWAILRFAITRHRDGTVLDETSARLLRHGKPELPGNPLDPG